MKGSVYAIRSHQTKDIYIGSTKETLSHRMAGHRRHYKLYLNDKYNYVTSFELLQYEDAYIELIELIEYNNKSELTAREGHHIRNINCVNKRIENRTKKEWHNNNKEQIKDYLKDYYEKNKEQIKEQSQNYYENNKEQIVEKKQDYYEKNKEQIKKKSQEYRINNKEQIKNKQNEKITCECGSICSKTSIYPHKKTKKHQKFMQDFV
jgi:hypothetical protein